MESAVFVDFDNVYSQLRQLQPEVAERFARQPSHRIVVHRLNILARRAALHRLDAWALSDK